MILVILCWKYTFCICDYSYHLIILTYVKYCLICYWYDSPLLILAVLLVVGVCISGGWVKLNDCDMRGRSLFPWFVCYDFLSTSVYWWVVFDWSLYVKILSRFFLPLMLLEADPAQGYPRALGASVGWLNHWYGELALDIDTFTRVRFRPLGSEADSQKYQCGLCLVTKQYCHWDEKGVACQRCWRQASK